MKGEWALVGTTVRSDASALERLLHPEFAERGQSGRWWSREATLQALLAEAAIYDAPEFAT